MNASRIIKDFGTFFEIACQQRVIFYYVGYFSQNVVAAMADAVRLQLEMSGVNGPTRRKMTADQKNMTTSQAMPTAQKTPIWNVE